jgi:hypothetical protein
VQKQVTPLLILIQARGIAGRWGPGDLTPHDPPLDYLFTAVIQHGNKVRKKLSGKLVLLHTLKLLSSLPQHAELLLYSRTFIGRLGLFRRNEPHSLIFKIANHISRENILQPLEIFLYRKGSDIIDNIL